MRAGCYNFPVISKNCTMSGVSISSAGRHSITLDAATARALDKVAKVSGKSKAALTRAALREYLEDYWDMLEVRRRMKRRAKGIPLDEVVRRLGLED